jgi:hypothetical protein
MKYLSLINPKIKEILGQAVFSGMEKGHSDVSDNKIYDVGIGIDVKQRVVNVNVNYALNNAILAANEATLSAETVEHSSGHALKITHSQFIIYPKQVDYQSSDWADEANYHKKLIENNPSKQYDLFETKNPDNSVFVQLLFGKNKSRFFAVLRILDPSDGIYEEEELNLQAADTLAPKEEVRTQKKFPIRSEKVSGQ